MLQIFEATTGEHHVAARVLFEEYAGQLGHDLEFQHFSQELEALPGAYTPPHGRLLLATQENELVGCVALRRQSATVCEMKRLYVRERFRGQRIGRQLAVEIIKKATQIGYHRMRLDTLASMDVPRTLYRALGFRETAAYYDNPIPGAVFFELELRRGPSET